MHLKVRLPDSSNSIVLAKSNESTTVALCFQGDLRHRVYDSVFAFAGIWDRWRNPKNELIETCSIITTSANALVSGIHDRMPVILERENYDVWLDLGFRKVEPLLDLLLPYRADSMRQYRVSTRVNSVQNDDPACAEEYSPQMYLEKLNRRASEVAQSTDEQIGTVTVQ
jgi:hypothetical protein